MSRYFDAIRENADKEPKGIMIPSFELFANKGMGAGIMTPKDVYLYAYIATSDVLQTSLDFSFVLHVLNWKLSTLNTHVKKLKKLGLIDDDFKAVDITTL